MKYFRTVHLLSSLFMLSGWVIFKVFGTESLIWFILALLTHVAVLRWSFKKTYLKLALPKGEDIARQLVHLPGVLPVFFVWLMAGVFFAAPWAGLSVGLVLSMVFMLMLLSCQVLVSALRGYCREIIHIADKGVSKIAHSGVRAVDRVRIAAGTYSVLALVLFTAEGVSHWHLTLAVILGALFALGAAAALVFVSWQQVKRLRSGLTGRGPKFIAADIALYSVDVLFYLCEPQESDALEDEHALVRRIDSEGFNIGAVMRYERSETLSKTPIHCFWFSPLILTLDSFVQPQIQAVIYAKNDPLNMHFTPLRALRHVLVVTGALARRQSLPNTVAAYDAVVAPDIERAYLWIATLPEDISRLVVVIDPATTGATQSEGTRPQVYPSYRALFDALKGIR